MKLLPYILIPMFLLGCSPSQNKLQIFAEDYVNEHQEKWEDRAEYVSLVTIGTKEDDVLKYLGEPDSKSDSDTVKNWLYWVSASLKDGQISKDVLILKMEAGVVVDRKQHTGFRQDIADVYKENHQ